MYAIRFSIDQFSLILGYTLVFSHPHQITHQRWIEKTKKMSMYSNSQHFCWAFKTQALGLKPVAQKVTWAGSSRIMICDFLMIKSGGSWQKFCEDYHVVFWIIASVMLVNLNLNLDVWTTEINKTCMVNLKIGNVEGRAYIRIKERCIQYLLKSWIISRYSQACWHLLECCRCKAAPVILSSLFHNNALRSCA
jgi:hypothetical protein